MGNKEGNTQLVKFSNLLEKSVIDTVESGLMTKDLAISVKGTTKLDKKDYLNTEEFIDAVSEKLILNA